MNSGQKSQALVVAVFMVEKAGSFCLDYRVLKHEYQKFDELSYWWWACIIVDAVCKERSIVQNICLSFINASCKSRSFSSLMISAIQFFQVSKMTVFVIRTVVAL